MATLTGKDSLVGQLMAQDFSEWAQGVGTCTAPDGSTGAAFTLVADNQIQSYQNGSQLLITFKTGTGCFSLTGSQSGTENGNIVGGAGKFAKASGTVTETFTGTAQLLGTPPGKLGFIGMVQESITGNVTP